MLDFNSPAPSETAPPEEPSLTQPELTDIPPEPVDQPSTIEFAPADLERFGLADCAPGSEYTATIRFQHAGPAGGVDAPGEAGEGPAFELRDVTDVMPAESDAEALPEPAGLPPSEELSESVDDRRAARGTPPPVDFKKLRGGSV